MSGPSGGPRPYASSPVGGHLPGGPPLQRRKKPVWPWIVGPLVVFLVVPVVVGYLVFEVFEVQFSKEGRKEAQGISVTYVLEGTATDVDITYHSRDEKVVSENQPSLPWRQDATVGGYTRRASVDAVSSSLDGVITCQIIVDGRVLAEHTSQAPYARAFCAAEVPE